MFYVSEVHHISSDSQILMSLSVTKTHKLFTYFIKNAVKICLLKHFGTTENFLWQDVEHHPH